VKGLMAVDHALELRRRAKELERSGDTRRAQVLLADSAELLDGARARIAADSKIRPLLESIVKAWRQSEGTASYSNSTENNDNNVQGPEQSLEGLEEEIDAELDRLITELERTLATILAQRSSSPDVTTSISSSGHAVVAFCKYGCGRTAKPGHSGGRTYDTCCRACGKARGRGGHDPDCTGPPGVASAALVPASTALAVISDALEPHAGPAPAGSGSASSSAGARGSGDSAGASKGDGGNPAQEALRLLGLSDEWPTDLTMREIRRRYMRECLGCHPDKGPPEEKEWRTSRFQELSTAYGMLELQMAVLERIRGGGGGWSSTDAEADPCYASTSSGAREGGPSSDERRASGRLPELPVCQPALPHAASSVHQGRELLALAYDPQVDTTGVSMPGSGHGIFGNLFGCLQTAKAT